MGWGAVGVCVIGLGLDSWAFVPTDPSSQELWNVEDEQLDSRDIMMLISDRFFKLVKV